MTERAPLDEPGIDTSVRVGSITLRAPVMTASGTAGYGVELADYVDLNRLGAVVVKSLAAYDWPGNPAPRLGPAPQGMLNSVGLQGPGVEAWLRSQVPHLEAAGATVIASIWGRSVDEFARAAEILADAPSAVVAVEVNLSCPNLEEREAIFAHDARAAAAVIAATARCGRPRWAKLSPNTDRLIEVADAVANAGAEAVTLVNTVLGRLLDPATLRPVLGRGSGGLSGRAIHPIAVRAVHDVHSALPELAIVGVGGIASGWDAIEMMISGASAVQIGTATFADPRAPQRVLDEMIDWAHERGITHLRELRLLG